MHAMSVFSKWADQYLNFEKHPQKNIFWLDTMKYLASRLGNPQDFCPCVHVAGSKGKGSVSTMTATILDCAGFNTGLYTSPHIIKLEERIGSAKGPFSEDVYNQSVKELMSLVDSVDIKELPGERDVTWFELVTLLGMLCFRNAKTNWSVYEVGLGGRLDATNIIDPRVCCITPIELEHTQYLGDTVEKIAGEKGGIIKSGIPVVIAGQKDSVKDVFRNIAEQKNAPLIFADECSSIRDISYVRSDNGTVMQFTIESPYFKRPLRPVLKMLGDFQCYNAALAALACKVLFPDMDESIIEKGLGSVSMHGRFEVLNNLKSYKDIPELILDGAHTVNSIHYTMDTFEQIYDKEDKKKAHLLFGCASDKDVEDIALFFREHFDSVIITKPGEVKESDLPRMERAFDRSGIEYESFCDCHKAIAQALERACVDKAPLLVTGSFYLVSEVKKYLSNL